MKIHTEPLPNSFILKRKHLTTSKHNNTKINDAVHMQVVSNNLEITLRPTYARNKVRDLINITGKNILVLNLNHPHAYGHIYSEVFSELYAVDKTYPEYDCIVTPITSLMKQIIEFFNLNISHKIKFIDTKSTETYLLECDQLEVVTHAPCTYTNKTKNVLALKNAFHELRPIINTPKPFVLFCSRSTVYARNGRNLTTENENDIIEYLKQYSDKNNLEFYLLTGEEPDGSKTSIVKQYELFSNAKVVVGPHGGVFSNSIFLDPKKKPTIIELCPTQGKTFRKLFNGAINTFAKYKEILLLLPPEAQIKTVNGTNIKIQQTIDLLKDFPSTIEVSELKKLLPLNKK